MPSPLPALPVCVIKGTGGSPSPALRLLLQMPLIARLTLHWSIAGESLASLYPVLITRASFTPPRARWRGSPPPGPREADGERTPVTAGKPASGNKTF